MFISGGTGSAIPQMKFDVRNFFWLTAEKNIVLKTEKNTAFIFPNFSDINVHHSHWNTARVQYIALILWLSKIVVAGTALHSGQNETQFPVLSKILSNNIISFTC